MRQRARCLEDRASPRGQCLRQLVVNTATCAYVVHTFRLLLCAGHLIGKGGQITSQEGPWARYKVRFSVKAPLTRGALLGVNLLMLPSTWVGAEGCGGKWVKWQERKMP